jgi:hypothetical protein
MMNLSTLLFVGLLTFSSMTTSANNANNEDQTTLPESLIVDRSIVGKSEINFPNDDNIHPKTSDFTVVSCILMSGVNGERWATITIANTSTGQRLLDKEQLLVLFANGDRQHPMLAKKVFKGKEKLSLNVFLGYHKFPALSVYSSRDE